MEALAYVHVAGGVERGGVWHDTHAHPVPRVVLDVLAELRARVEPAGVLLERDDDFPPEGELAGELEAIRRVLGDAAGAVPGPPSLPSAGSAPTTAPTAGGPGSGTDAVRTRVGIGQAALLSALVAGTPVPEGFDRQRVRIQARALSAKRAGVVARLAPELPGILGGQDPYREAFLGYARHRPMTAGYRRDALDFAEHLLIRDLPADPAARRRLTLWWQDRAGARPPGRAVRWARALVGRAA